MTTAWMEDSSMGFYERLGVKPMINAWGTVTKVGGSRMDLRVLEAMTDASRMFVDIYALQDRACAAIASMLGVQAASITSGAASGLAISAAACMAGDDEVKILALPDTTGMRNEALVLKAHRVLYDQAMRLTGVRMLEVGLSSFATIAQVEAAITDRTALFFYVAESATARGSVPLKDICTVMKRHGIPVVVDAAAELPPMSNLTAFLEAGADLVVFSGGKEIRGPQASGLILSNNADLIRCCRLNGYPDHGAGRSMKVDKETIAGLVTAIEIFVTRDYDQIYAEWESMASEMVAGLADVEGITVRRGLPTQPGIQPADVPRAYLRPHRVTAVELQTLLRNGTPGVFCGVEGDEVALNPQTLDRSEIPAVIGAVVAAVRS